MKRVKPRRCSGRKCPVASVLLWALWVLPQVFVTPLSGSGHQPLCGHGFGTCRMCKWRCPATPEPDDKFQSAYTTSRNRTSEGGEVLKDAGTQDALENPAAPAAPAPATRAMPVSVDPELLDILRHAPRRADARVKSAELLRRFCLSHEASASKASNASNGTGEGIQGIQGISCKDALDFTPLCRRISHFTMLCFTPLKIAHRKLAGKSESTANSMTNPVSRYFVLG